MATETERVDDLRRRVALALEEVRPALRLDGGDAELVGVRDGSVVEIRLLGTCGSCPMAALTLASFVEERIKARVPEIQQVVSV